MRVGEGTPWHHEGAALTGAASRPVGVGNYAIRAPARGRDYANVDRPTESHKRDVKRPLTTGIDLVKRFVDPYVGRTPYTDPVLPNLEILMDRFRLPLATFVLFLAAACQSAPTAPAEPQTPAANAQLGGDTVITEAARGGSTIGSGN